MTWTFPFIPHTPTDPCISHTCYPPISPVSLRAPYFPYLPPCLYIASTLLGAAGPSFVWGIGHCLLFDTPYLSSGLSLEKSWIEFGT